MKDMDSGADQRNTLQSVKIACICLFKKLHLDFMIWVRCVPRHSYMNTAERIKSIPNLELQNVATEQASCDDESIEKIFKKIQ